MEQQEFRDESIEVVKSEDIGLHRQTIHLVSQDRFLTVMERMMKLMRLGKYTGHIRIQMNQGGVKKIETEQETKK